MSNKLSKENTLLLSLLKSSLTNNYKEYEEIECSTESWVKIIDMADSHAVLPLIYYKIESQKNISSELKKRTDNISKGTVMQNYRLLFLTRYINELFKDNGIISVPLKGCTTACFYPEPELRKSGDIDILIPNYDDMQKAINLLLEKGFVSSSHQNSNHHITVISPDNITIELHRMLSEPFDSEKANKNIMKIKDEYSNVHDKKVFSGVYLSQVSDSYTGFYLMLHMLHHFLRAGFGLKLLCDWTVFWNRDIDQFEKDHFMKLVNDTGLSGFVSMITEVCVKYLGLDKDKSTFMMKEKYDDKSLLIFLNDVLDSEEFGKTSKDRMVVLRGTSIVDYFREFHHQMKLNHRKYAKYHILWPLLWIITLAVFIKNNYKIRKTSSIAVIKSAKERSAVMKGMNLFK